MGGPWGIADSSLPALLFVVVYTLFGNDIQTAGIAAVALGGVIAVIRLTRGESARFALTGFFGVALAAFIACRSLPWHCGSPT